jgi:hypothetical protein
MKKARITAIVVCLLVAGVMQQGCKKDHGDKPSLPPSSGFVMNFSDIDSTKVPSSFFKTTGTDSAGDYTNYVYSAGNVFVWNVIISVGLAVPVASFLNSFHYEAEWDNQADAWLWNYDYAVAGTTYSAELQAKVTGDQVHWEMYVSKQAGFQNFLWYSGDSKLDNTQGTWTLYDNPTSNKELLGIVWHNSGTADITYTNIIPGGAENGGYISYGTTSDATYNAFYDIFNKGKNNHTNIEWNKTYMNGRVKDSLHFGDTNWHCWDVDYSNTTCP